MHLFTVFIDNRNMRQNVITVLSELSVSSTQGGAIISSRKDSDPQTDMTQTHER